MSRFSSIFILIFIINSYFVFILLIYLLFAHKYFTYLHFILLFTFNFFSSYLCMSYLILSFILYSFKLYLFMFYLSIAINQPNSFFLQYRYQYYNRFHYFLFVISMKLTFYPHGQIIILQMLQFSDLNILLILFFVESNFLFHFLRMLFFYILLVANSEECSAE